MGSPGSEIGLLENGKVVSRPTGQQQQAGWAGLGWLGWGLGAGPETEIGSNKWQGCVPTENMSFRMAKQILFISFLRV